MFYNISMNYTVAKIPIISQMNRSFFLVLNAVPKCQADFHVNAYRLLICLNMESAIIAVIHLLVLGWKETRL